MAEHDHPPENTPVKKPVQDEVAKNAYAIYLKEGGPQGHADQNWSEAQTQLQHIGSDHPAEHDHHDHHSHMAADFRKRFWISRMLTLPTLVLSPIRLGNASLGFVPFSARGPPIVKPTFQTRC